MLFCSYAYLYFFAIVFTLYWATSNPRLRLGILLLASFIFYATWNTWLALLIFGSALGDFVVARCIENSPSNARKRFLLGLSLVLNLGLLAYFKYANFFLESLQQVLEYCGAHTSIPLLKTLLPIGISFYTFEAINYTVDVYRGKVKAERNLTHFLLFILFFPHLVAGPIVRAADFLPQIRRTKRWSWLRAGTGVQFFLMGLFKKLVIADRMALLADPVFANPQDYAAYTTWIAVLAYALQIYCDFSGYTDMAIGSAHLLGFHLARNFNMPYLACNIADFWRRWHISLSTWLRDYLFIPLGGSRGGRLQTCRNLLITMTLGGLWHGASWTFVVWGVIHGLLLVGHRLFQDAVKGAPLVQRFFASLPGRLFGIALTFLTVALTWVFFRAESFDAALTVLSNLFDVRTIGARPAMHSGNLWFLLIVVVSVHILAAHGIWKRLQRLPSEVLGVGYSVVLTATMVLTPDIGKAFIYFQF